MLVQLQAKSGLARRVLSRLVFYTQRGYVTNVQQGHYPTGVSSLVKQLKLNLHDYLGIQSANTNKVSVKITTPLPFRIAFYRVKDLFSTLVISILVISMIVISILVIKWAKFKTHQSYQMMGALTFSKNKEDTTDN